MLKTATHRNTELLALSGPPNPFPGKLGVFEKGVFADPPLANGDPVANIKLLEDQRKNPGVIVKNGQVFKYAVPDARSSVPPHTEPKRW